MLGRTCRSGVLATSPRRCFVLRNALRNHGVLFWALAAVVILAFSWTFLMGAAGGIFEALMLPFALLLQLALPVAAIAVAIWLALRLLPVRWNRLIEGGDVSSDEILKRRYAAGEITRDQYVRMKQDLRS